MSFLFVKYHLPGEMRTLPSIFLRSKKGHTMGSFAQRTDRAAPCRVSPSAPKDTKVFSLVSFLFVCNCPPGRDENAIVHLFAQHFPAFQIKAENPGTGVPGKEKLADEYGKRKSGRSHKDLPLYWRHHPDLNWGIKALQASALPLGYGAGKRMGTM